MLPIEGDGGGVRILSTGSDSVADPMMGEDTCRIETEVLAASRVGVVRVERAAVIVFRLTSTLGIDLRDPSDGKGDGLRVSEMGYRA